MKKFTGFTSDTPKKLLLDAGAFLKNYVPGTDTYDSAKTAGKIIGATGGGGVFAAIPTFRPIQLDGVKEDTKGLVVIDQWKITLTANLKEISVDALKMALGTGVVVDGPIGYKKITASSEIVDADYIDNIAWVGRLSGSEVPVIILVKNALNTNGLTITVADKGESVISLTFTGNYEADEEDPPFEIYYPDVTVV